MRGFLAETKDVFAEIGRTFAALVKDPHMMAALALLLVGVAVVALVSGAAG